MVEPLHKYLLRRIWNLLIQKTMWPCSEIVLSTLISLHVFVSLQGEICFSLLCNLSEKVLKGEMIAVSKCTERVSAREINSLIKLKANVRTRLNCFKLVMDKFPSEIRKKKVPNYWSDEIPQHLS